MTDLYVDPENLEEILEHIKSLKTLGEISEYCIEIFPTWLVGKIPKFSSDYPHLTKNWKIVCDNIGTVPKEIILVDRVFFDNNHKLIHTFSELYTRSGFVVRQNHDWFKCKVCGDALPSETVFDIFRNSKVNVPTTWDSVCTVCK
jgi:hypothetical protein